MEGNKLEEIRKIFPIRLQNARKILAMSQAQLAERMSDLAKQYPGIMKAVSTTAIEKYEAGEMLPESSAILTSLSRALKVSVDDLYRPFTVVIDKNQFKFRKKSRLGKKAEEAIKLSIQQRIEKYVEIEQIANQKPEFDGKLDLVISDDNSAREAAIRLRNRWNLGLGPILNPINVLEQHGVKVIEIESNPELFDGTSIQVEGVPVLVINKQDKTDSSFKYNNNEERRRLTLWHEYCHQAATFGPNIDEKKEEELCNIFANEMLIPSSTFKQIVGEKRNMISSWELKNIQREYGISVRALMVKAQQLGIITNNRYRWYFLCLAKPENEMFRKQMDQSETAPHHTSRYEQLVYRCLVSETISTSKAASLLGITVPELQQNLNFENANGYSY